MDANHRLSVACAVSVCAHLALMIAPLVHPAMTSASARQALEAVLLPARQAPPLRETVARFSEDEPAAETDEAAPSIPREPDTATPSGVDLPLPLPPPSQTSRQPAMLSFADAQQLAFLAQQREQRAMQLQVAMASAAARLQPALHARYECRQTSDHALVCAPAPSDEALAALRLWASIARESLQAGIIDNPLRLDFADDRGVSLTVMPQQR